MSEPGLCTPQASCTAHEYQSAPPLCCSIANYNQWAETWNATAVLASEICPVPVPCTESTQYPQSNIVVGHRKQVNGGTRVTGYYGYFRRFFAQFLSNYNRCLEAVGTPTLDVRQIYDVRAAGD